MAASGHVRYRRLDRFAADDGAVADVENAVRGEGGYVEIVILEIEREQVACLQVLDLRALLCVAGISGILGERNRQIEMRDEPDQFAAPSVRRPVSGDRPPKPIVLPFAVKAWMKPPSSPSLRGAIRIAILSPGFTRSRV